MALLFMKNLYFRKKNSFMTPFFTQFVFHTHSITLLLEILGGTDAWAVPHTSNFWGTVPPVSPLVSAHEQDLSVGLSTVIRVHV